MWSENTMSDIAIRVENIGKRYRIGEIAAYKTLRDTLSDAVTRPFRRLPRNPRPRPSPRARTSCRSTGRGTALRLRAPIAAGCLRRAARRWIASGSTASRPPTSSARRGSSRRATPVRGNARGRTCR